MFLKSISTKILFFEIKKSNNRVKLEKDGGFM
jgi:hypothetical protein